MAGYGHAENLADAGALATMLRTLDRTGEADDRARARRGLRRRRGPRRLLRHRDRRAGRDVRAVGGEARADPGDDRPLRDRGDRRARRRGATSSPPSASPRPRRYRIGLVHDIVPADELDARVNELLGALLVAGPRGAGGGQGADPRGRARPHRRRGDRRHRRAHRRRARVAGRRAKASRRSSTRAPPAWVPEALRKRVTAMAPDSTQLRHLAAGRARRGARLGERHPALRGAVHRRRARASSRWIELPGGLARARASVGAGGVGIHVRRRVLRRQDPRRRLGVGRRAHVHPDPGGRGARRQRVRRRVGGGRRSPRRSSAARSRPAATSRSPAAAR